MITADLIRKQRAAHRVEIWRRINAISRVAMDLSADAANTAYLASTRESAEDTTVQDQTNTLLDLEAQERMLSTHLKLIAEDIQRLCVIADARPKAVTS